MSPSSASLLSGSSPVTTFSKSCASSSLISLEVALVASLRRYSQIESYSLRSSQIPWQSGHQSITTPERPNITERSLLEGHLGQTRDDEIMLVFSISFTSRLSQCN